jgi:two-component system LytT family response regulator
MSEITAILIDDEPACSETLALELELYCPKVKILAICQSASEGLAKISELKPNLVFLDIEMPRMNGFEMLQQLPQIHFELIFVTAYNQFALKAFKFSAVDYLLKPVDSKSLIAAVSKVEERITKHISTEHIEALLANINFLRNDFPNVAVPTAEGIEFVPVADILYCEADSNYTYIHLENGQRMLLAKTLKDVEEMFERHLFVRIHQSYLVSLKKVRKYVRGQGGSVIMFNGKELPVAKSRKDSLMVKLSQ